MNEAIGIVLAKKQRKGVMIEAQPMESSKLHKGLMETMDSLTHLKHPTKTLYGVPIARSRSQKEEMLETI